jgi:AhpD family alkylhydroperoxidase
VVHLVEERDAEPQVAAIYDDIKSMRKIDWISNFWKTLANHPATLERIWEDVKVVMAPGALDSLTKELIYLTVSICTNCDYCIAAHTAAARAKGMSKAQWGELLAVVGLASGNNRLAIGYAIPIDERYLAEPDESASSTS